jgi:2-dehydropantoate 2-reductase
MGLLFGALLTRGGCKVTLVARRPEAAESVKTGGISFEEHGLTRNYGGVGAVTHIKDAPLPDLVILSVKGPDTGAVIAGAAPHIPASASVLTLQNGLGNIEAITEHIPVERVLAGVSYTGATLLGPAWVRLGGYGEILLGELSGELSPRLLALVRIFERSGLEARPSENIQGAIWSKVLVNAGINPIAALTRLKNGELAARPESRALMALLISEGASLAGRLGIKLAEADPVAHAIRVASATGSNAASMLQDVMRGNKTEIESLNGMLARKAREVGFDLPLNNAVTLLLRLLEKSFESS